MVDNSTQPVGPLTVWTQTPVGGSGSGLTADAASFPWGWNWIKEPRLDASGNTCVRLAKGKGSGTLTILRQTRAEPTSAKQLLRNDVLVAGMYVAITCDTASLTAQQLDPTKILWWGFISAINYAEVAGTLDGIGTATVLEVGHLLDETQVYGWRRVRADGGYGEPINTPPTANIADPTTYIVGNAKSVVNLDGNGHSGFAFARLPEDCGTQPNNYWTRWRLLNHLLLCCGPGGLPPISVACADGSAGFDPGGTGTIAGYLNDTAVPEVYDLRNLTFSGALELCAPQSRGFNWTIELDGTKGWQIVVYSYSDSGSFGLPVNSSNSGTQYTGGIGDDISSDGFTTDLKVVNSALPPDEVQMEGAPIVWGNTVSFADSNLKEGWRRGSGFQEDLYRIAASGAVDYNSLAYSVQLERNAMVRSAPGLRDVYQRFGLYAYANGDITTKSPPGDGKGGADLLCPEIEWDGTTVTIGAGISRCPYLPTATLLRTIPWPEGVQSDGTELRKPSVQYLPQFLKPKLFRYDSSDSLYPWLDLESRNGRPGFPSMHLDVDDRGAAFRVVLSQPEYLARNHWRDSAGGTTSPATSDIDPDSSFYAIDYTKLVATIAIESDQRVLVKIRRPGLGADSQIRKRLVLRDPNLQCWVMKVGAIIGLKNDGTPDRVSAGGAFTSITGGTGGILIRNDFSVAQKRCSMAAAWAFRKRVAVAIERAQPASLPVYARIGYLVTKLIEQQPDRLHSQVALSVNTVVESLVFNFGSKPRLTIATNLPGMLGFPPLPGAGGGAAGGGGVSAQLGGTVGQAAQGLQQALAGTQRDTNRVPLIIPRSYPRNAVYSVKIDQGNTLTDGSKGIKWASTPITSVPSAYDPNSATSFIDGIGRGVLYVDGVEQSGYVLIVNDGRGGIGGFDLLGDTIADTCIVGQPITMPVGSGPQSVLVYAPVTI